LLGLAIAAYKQETWQDVPNQTDKEKWTIFIRTSFQSEDTTYLTARIAGRILKRRSFEQSIRTAACCYFIEVL
jgi:hypothetical protein